MWIYFSRHWWCGWPPQKFQFNQRFTLSFQWWNIPCLYSQIIPIWFSGDLTDDKTKDETCSLNLSFLFCHVQNELGLTTGTDLGSELGLTAGTDLGSELGLTAGTDLGSELGRKMLQTQKRDHVSHSVMSESLWLHGLQPTRLHCPWDFPGKNTGVGCHSLLQGIFPTQRSNPRLPHCG